MCSNQQRATACSAGLPWASLSRLKAIACSTFLTSASAAGASADRSWAARAFSSKALTCSGAVPVGDDHQRRVDVMPDAAVIRALLGGLGRIGRRILAVPANLVRPDRRPAEQPAGFAVLAQALGHRAGKILLKTGMMLENRHQLLDGRRGRVARRKLLVGHEHRQYMADFMPGQGGRGDQRNRETTGENMWNETSDAFREREENKGSSG